MAKHGSRYRTSALAALQPRSRRETVFLIGILIIATFFIVRICQFRSLTPRGNTITAVLSTTQVVRGKHGPDGEDEPTAVFTEVFIDSGSGEGFKRPRKQPDVQVKYDNQRKPSLQKSALGSNKADALSDVSKGTAQENRSDSSDRSVQRRSAVDAQQLDGLRTKLDPQSGVLPANISSSVITDNSKSVNSQVIAANSLAGQQERTAQKRVTDKVPSAQNAQQAMLQQSQVQKALPQSPPPPPPVTRQRITSAPADFDWQTYLLYNPELRDAGIGTQQQAEEHYVQKGYAQGLIYKRLRVLLRYTACTGLINQHYSHIAAFSLCAVLGAELVLPPAVKRDSFAHYFSVFKEHNEVKWTPAPLESLLNVDKIVEFWRGRGLTVHRTPALLPFPDLTQPELAYPMYPQPEIDPELIARIDDVYLRNLDMPELIEKARIAVIGHAGKLLRQDPGRKIDYIVLDMPCTFFMLRSLSNLRVVTEVARSLEFSDQVANLADRVIHGMTMGGKNEYNAVHLRIEKDARDWSQIMGGEQVVWRGYVQSMLQASFTSDLVLYAASGLLTYGANDEMDNLIGSLKDAGLCKDVHYKELYIPQAELEELNSEQKALVDFLVLSRGRGFVGFGSSTFSFYLREFRVLSGIPRSSSVLVDASVIGTDPLFNSAGTVI
ncbi:hypothetical protein WJX82_010329 [Trebouxia sp. C0006]